MEPGNGQHREEGVASRAGNTEVEQSVAGRARDQEQPTEMQIMAQAMMRMAEQ